MTPACSCPRTRRRWTDAGDCSRCGLRVAEGDLMRAIRAVLIADPKCLLWRNEIGSNTHWPDGRRREHPIKYGVCNPGGADLLGCYGPRQLAVETKTSRGVLSPDQVNFGRWLALRGNVYAVVRSEADAVTLLAWLQAGTPAAATPTFVFSAVTA